MKTFYLLLCFILGSTSGYSQISFGTRKEPILNPDTNLIETNAIQNKTVSNNEQQTTDLIYDCNTVFWTVTITGEIRQWNLISNQVTGGDVVQTGAGTSLAFGGADNDLTFYTTYNGVSGIKKYDNATSDWIAIPSTLIYNNAGAYHEKFYFFSSGNAVLNYFDGTNFSSVPDSATTYYKVADIAVDSLGRAWVFTGPTNDLYVDTLKVFDPNGLVATYYFSNPLYANGCYGDFFINDQLYVGRFDNVIIPININGTVASAGTLIPFVDNNYADLASCNIPSSLQTAEYDLEHQMNVYPNPIKDILNINLKEEVLLVYIYSIDGKLIKTVQNTKSIDISDLANSTYILKVISKNNVYTKFIVKK